MIKSIIIEDEKHSQDLLSIMLNQYCDDIQVEGIAGDVVSGIHLIKSIRPDLVFLDVELSGGTGFDVLNSFEHPSFKVIFVTGYDHYALKAIKYSALDYLLKPVNLSELRKSIKKLQNAAEGYSNNFQHLKNNLDSPNEGLKQIVLSDSKSYRVLKIDNIVFVEAERSYVIFHLVDNSKFVAVNTLTHYVDILPKPNFFRIHKSYIINCSKVSKIETGRGGPVHLDGGNILPIAFRRKPAFIRFLDSISF